MAGGFEPGGAGFGAEKKKQGGGFGAPSGTGQSGLKPSKWIGAAPKDLQSGGHVPSSATSAAEMGGALDTGTEHGNPKSYGIDQGDQDNPHSYLGHFANDNVLKVGHNVGHKKKGGQAAVIGMAKKGYRKLPGSAVVHQGNTSRGSLPDAAHGLAPSRSEKAKSAAAKRSISRMMMKGLPLMAMPSMPPTTSNKKMSIKHETERVAFNEKHARDHKADAAAARQKIKQLKRHKPPKG